MKAIQLDSLKAISSATAKEDDRERLEVKWFEINEEGKEEEFDGHFFLLKNIGYGPVLRLSAAGDITARTAALLVERVRLGDNGEQKITYEDARNWIESDSPLVAAICNKCWHRLKEINDQFEAEAKAAAEAAKLAGGDAEGNAAKH